MLHFKTYYFFAILQKKNFEKNPFLVGGAARRENLAFSPSIFRPKSLRKCEEAGRSESDEERVDKRRFESTLTVRRRPVGKRCPGMGRKTSYRVESWHSAVS
jgi:hypothetical protein